MLKNKVVFITGASRGIGRAIALKCAKHGANIVIAAKTTKPHPKLPGTIYSVEKEIIELGSQALAIEVDVRDAEVLQKAITQAAEHFGGIDICVNNASAICLDDIENIAVRKYDLIHSINTRGTYLSSKFCLEYLKKSSIGQILNISPPLNMDPKWFDPHLAYTISKYGMSMCTLGMAKSFQDYNIKVNSLWPKTTIATSAVKEFFPEQIYQASRYPEIMADAAYEIFVNLSETGQFYQDEIVLRNAGVNDFSQYALNPNLPLFTDLFIE